MVEPDLKIINSFKRNRDDESFNYLLERFGKIYEIILRKYIYVKDYFYYDLLEEKSLFLFKCILDYRQNRGCKFSTYFTKRCIWLTQNVNKNRKLGEDIEAHKWHLLDEEKAFDCIAFTGFKDFLKNEPDDRIKTIFEKRYKSGNVTWKNIAKEINLSREGTRILHNNFIKKYKQKHER